MKTTTEKLLGVVSLWMAVSLLPRPTDAYSSLAGSCDHAGVIHGVVGHARGSSIYSFSRWFFFFFFAAPAHVRRR